MAKLLSLRGYARHRGVALQAVQKAIRDGRITLVKDKDGKDKVDPGSADKQWDLSTDKSKQRKQDRGGSDTAKAYAEARAVRENFMARIAQLDYETKAKKLINVEDVKREIFELTRQTRDAILNIPNRISNELASETDPVKVHNYLTAELVKALEDLVNAGRREGDS